MLADGALAATGRVALAYDAFALSVEAFAAPLEAYDPELAELWGDDGESRALERLGAKPGQSPITGGWWMDIDDTGVLLWLLGKRGTYALRSSASRSARTVSTS